MDNRSITSLTVDELRQIIEDSVKGTGTLTYAEASKKYNLTYQKLAYNVRMKRIRVYPKNGKKYLLERDIQNILGML